MITLYHGSNVAIEDIDLSRSHRCKDFGCGFYLNGNREQAWHMAVRTTARMECGEPTVTTFSFDERNLTDNADIKVLTFEDYTVEWAEFVLANRRYKGEGNVGGYDIVVGPIADDTVGVQLYRFTRGFISIEQMIDELRVRGNRAVQYYFGTPRAIALLTHV